MGRRLLRGDAGRLSLVLIAFTALVSAVILLGVANFPRVFAAQQAASAAQVPEAAPTKTGVAARFTTMDWHDRRIDIVDPEATSKQFVARIEKVFGTAANQFSTIKVNGFDALKAKRLRLIAARAADVSIAKLFDI